MPNPDKTPGQKLVEEWTQAHNIDFFLDDASESDLSQRIDRLLASRTAAEPDAVCGHCGRPRKDHAPEAYCPSPVFAMMTQFTPVELTSHLSASRQVVPRSDIIMALRPIFERGTEKLVRDARESANSVNRSEFADELIDMIEALQIPAPQPSRENVVSADVVAFLHGRAPLDGVWFGEKHPTLPGNYWWRKFLSRPPVTEPSRASVLVDALEELSKLGNGNAPGNSDGNVIAQRALARYRESVTEPGCETPVDHSPEGGGQGWSEPTVSPTNACIRAAKAVIRALNLPEGAGVAMDGGNDPEAWFQWRAFRTKPMIHGLGSGMWSPVHFETQSMGVRTIGKSNWTLPETALPHWPGDWRESWITATTPEISDETNKE
jgi:hypothetical protein